MTKSDKSLQSCVQMLYKLSMLPIYVNLDHSLPDIMGFQHLFHEFSFAGYFQKQFFNHVF